MLRLLGCKTEETQSVNWLLHGGEVLSLCGYVQVPYFPPAQSLADFTPNVLKTLLVAAMGQPGISVNVKSVRTWSMHAEVADKFQVCPQWGLHIASRTREKILDFSMVCSMLWLALGMLRSA